MILDLASLRWHRMRPGPPGGSTYLASGHVVSADDTGNGTLFAAPFDAEQLVTDGQGPPVLTDVRFLSSQSAYPHLAVSTNGTAVYLRREVEAGELMWVDRDGGETPTRAGDGIIAGIDMSPSGNEAVYHDENGTLLTLDMERMSAEVLVPNVPGQHGVHSAVWNPSGRTATFGWNREGSWDVFEIDIGARAEPRPLVVRPYDQFPGGWSADGTRLVYLEDHPETGMDVWVLAVGDEPVAVANSPSNERAPVISPNGDLIAYVSDEDGRDEVYVQAHPQGDVAIASAGGGEEPQWSPDGRELFFTQGDRFLSVTVSVEEGLEVSDPEELFVKAFDKGSTNSYARAYYDVAPDGRFLMLADRSTTEFQVIVNWFEELERLVPTGGGR